MNTWKMEIEYEGTRYRGWQILHNEKTVLGELMMAARQLFSSRAEIGGAERTDAGVHAVAQIAHLKVPELQTNITPKQILTAFNELLPHDINIVKVSNAPENFNARSDAAARYYLYQISTRRTAFGKNYVWWNKETLNVAEMRECAEMLVGRHDFRSFGEAEKDSKTSTLVTVERAEVFTDGNLVCFRLGANRFLWKMVRKIAGMIAEVGRGKSSVRDFQRLLKFQTNAAAQHAAPPSGLFLEKVLYKGDAPPNQTRAIISV